MLLYVVCEDMMCFIASVAGKPLTVSYYDPYAWCDPKAGYRTISYQEWSDLCRSNSATNIT